MRTATHNACGALSLFVAAILCLAGLPLPAQADPADIETQSRIDAAIAGAPAIAAHRVDVTVDGGVATVLGVLETERERRILLDLVETTPGVRTVVDMTTVEYPPYTSIRPWERMPLELAPPRYGDAGIHAGVTEAIHGDGRITSSSVAIAVNRGTVTLRGVVNSMLARQAAEQRAWSVPGVRGVVNNLEVLTDPTLSDTQLRAVISDAVIQHPNLSLLDIKVQVIKGVARLTGTVQTNGDRNELHNLVAGVRGIRGVINDVRIEAPYARAAVEPPPREPGVAPFVLKNDDAIESDIRLKMFYSNRVDGSRILAKVATGTATLTGTVGSEAERQAAEDIAFSAGASWVTNLLRIAPPELAMAEPAPPGNAAAATGGRQVEVIPPPTEAPPPPNGTPQPGP